MKNIKQFLHQGYIGIGANEGDILSTFNKACALIEAEIGPILRKSSLYESYPLTLPGSGEMGNFINAALHIETNCEVHELFQKLKKIEIECGRLEREKWRSRPLDLDILLYDELVIEDEILTIPHKGIETRDFVLMPLIELSKNIYHPKLDSSVSEIYKNLSDDHKFVFVTRDWN